MDGLFYFPNTNCSNCVKTGVGDIRTGYITLENSALAEFSIDNATSGNVRMYQGATNKNIHFDIYDGTLDQTTLTSSISQFTINSTIITVTGDLQAQNDIINRISQRIQRVI